MSVTAKLDLITKDIFLEKGAYNSLSKYEQQLIMTLYKLDEDNNPTDLKLFK